MISIIIIIVIVIIIIIIIIIITTTTTIIQLLMPVMMSAWQTITGPDTSTAWTHKAEFLRVSYYIATYMAADVPKVQTLKVCSSMSSFCSILQIHK